MRTVRACKAKVPDFLRLSGCVKQCAQADSATMHAAPPSYSTVRYCPLRAATARFCLCNIRRCILAVGQHTCLFLQLAIQERASATFAGTLDACERNVH